MFGEAYFHFVSVTNVPDAGAAGGIQNTAHAKGYAFNFGAEYTIPNNPVWFGASFNYLSGDKDVGPNKNINSFLSYGAINDLMILEDMYLGFDWDTNYWAFKVNGGFAMSLGTGKENLRIDGILGITKTAQTVAFATTSTKNLGDELDIHVRWILTKQASLHLGLGFLFSSDVLKDSMQASAGSDAKNHAIEYVLGADLKF